MRAKTNIFFFLGLLIPALLVFRALLLPGPFVWGDAPHFYPEGLRELVSEPYAWVNRGHNFGGINNILWLSPLMLLYGVLHTLFGLGNDVIIRTLFYFPAVILAFVTPLLFARYLKYSRTVQFFASLLYGLNTYFLLLVDGGQVGVAFAYGIFPLALLALRKLWDEPSFNNFYLALGSLILISAADPRIALISLLALAIWGLTEHVVGDRRLQLNKVRWTAVLVAAYVAVSSYWLLPLIKISGQEFEVSGISFVSMLHPLLLFQPHWPANQFGQVSSPPFYFVGIPLLVFASLFFPAKSKHLGGPATMSKTLGWAFLFLVFAFLVKGETPPAGQIYSWFLNIPFAAAFRDSTKFFTPLFLFGGLLIGNTVDKIISLRPRLKNPVILVVYIYLMFLIHPAVLGQLNGVLAARGFQTDFGVIADKLSQDNTFYRTAWFPERHPLASHTEEKPALDAKGLVSLRPLASLNVGTFDLFNFLHQREFLDWFDLLGIKYLVFSGEHRKLYLNEEEQKSWNKLLSLVDGVSGLVRIDWGTSFPIYKNDDTLPRIFGVDKAVLVVGADDIYGKLRQAEPGFSVKNQAFIFFEDGKFDPRTLEGLSSDSAVLVFNEKGETDLAMSFLQEHFSLPIDRERSQWAVREGGDYLRWKYELLTREIETQEFDYGRGIAFSTQKGERLYLEFRVPEDGEYMFAVRSMKKDVGRFSWSVEGPLMLTQRKREFLIENKSGIEVVNTAALVPKKKWDEAQQLVRNFTGHFKVVSLDERDGIEQLARLSAGRRWQEVGYEMASPIRYKISIPENVRWLVFSDNYGKNWELARRPINLPSYPLYSMINGFHPRPEWREAEIIFQGQKEVRWGLYFTIVSALSLAIIFLLSKGK